MIKIVEDLKFGPKNNKVYKLWLDFLIGLKDPN